MLTLTRLLSWRYLRRRALRVVLATISIALGVATLVASLVLSHSTRAAVEDTSSQLAGQADLQISNGRVGVDLSLLDDVKSAKGVKAAVPFLSEYVTVSLNDEQRSKALLLGIDPKSEEQVRDYGTSLRDKLQVNRAAVTDPAFWMHPGPFVVIGDGLKEQLALPDGARYLRVHTPRGVREVRILGTLPSEGAAAVVGGKIIIMELQPALEFAGRASIPPQQPPLSWFAFPSPAVPLGSAAFDASAALALMQAGENSPRRLTHIDVILEDGADLEKVREALQTKLQDKATVQSPKIRDTGLEDVLAGVQVSLTLGAIFALLVGIFLVYNSLAVTVAERRHEIGTLRALGATRGQIRTLFATEALILGVVGSALGVGGGVLLAHLSLNTIGEVLRQSFSTVDLRQVVVTPTILIGGFLAGVAVALIASLAPAATAAAEPPSDALRRVPPRLHALRYWWPILAAVVVALGAVGLYFLRDQLPTRMGTYGCALLAGLAFMLATPFVARLGVAVLRPLARLMGPGGRLAADDLARSPSRTGLTVGALGLGLALTITIAGVITSTEEPIFRWMEQVIDADLFVTSGNAVTGAGEHNLMAESLGEEIVAACSPHAEEVMPIRFQQIDYRGTRVLLTVLPVQIYRRHEHLPVSGGAPDAWEQMEKPGYHVLVSENFADLHGATPGRDIELMTPRGRVRWRVLATIPDYSWNRGTIIMDRAQYKESFGDTLVDSFDVFLVDGADPEQVRQDIHRHLGKDHDLMILTNAQLHEHIKRLLDQFYVLFYAEAAMALAVSFLGVANTLAISVLQRRREIGLLRAVGATRWQVAWSVAAQALLIGILGTVIGIALGMVAELYALRVVLVEDSGYYFAFLFPTLMTLLTAFFGLAAAQVAGALPASQAAWQPISEAIAYE